MPTRGGLDPIKSEIGIFPSLLLPQNFCGWSWQCDVIARLFVHYSAIKTTKICPIALKITKVGT